MEREGESNGAAKRAMAIVLEGRNEPMEQEGDLSSSSSFCSMRQCRICHEEEEEEERCAAMESPCACSGSLKYAHRGCVQRWCDEKGSTLCEICLRSFEPGYTIPPKKAPVVELLVTVSDEEEEEEEEEDEYQGMQYAVSDGAMDGSDRTNSSWCQSLTITFTIILLVWHFIAVVTIEAAEHCAFSLFTMYLLRAAGILLPFYAVMRVISMIQHGRRQYRLQLLQLQEQIRRNASNMHSTRRQEQQQLVISVH